MAKSAAAITTGAPGSEVDLGSFQILPLAKLFESPTNHRRKSWGNLDELAASIKSKGVLVPICVRPANIGLVEDAFEIVYGHRRFRAAAMAELAEIPALVRHLSDIEVIEAQIIENKDRQDVHPLEEAEGLELLLQPRGPYSIDDLAAKLGKSRGTVYARLKLLDLTAESRTAFYEGKLSPSTALHLARIPAELQKKALGLLTPSWRSEEDGPLPAREAARILQREFMARLDGAPFKLDDAELLPSAGTCLTCPKRSGTQPDLFQGVDEDVCTDPACFRSKVEGAWKRRTEEAAATGRRVLTEKETKGVFSYNQVAYGADYVDVLDACHEDPKGRTYKKLLGAKAKAEIVLARSPTGRVVELVPKEKVGELLKEAGHKIKIERPEPPADRKAERERQEREALLRVEVDRGVRFAFAKALNAREPSRECWDAALSAAREGAYGEETQLLQHVGLSKSDERDVVLADLEKWRKAADAKQLRMLTLVYLLDGELGAFESDKTKALFKWAGIDLKEIKKTAAAIVKEKAKAPKKSAGADAVVTVGDEDCLDCGVPASEPSPGCEECDHPKAKKAAKGGRRG